MHTHFSSFRSVPKTGVIYVTTEAAKRGFSYQDPTWANLGQGAPEVGPLAGEQGSEDLVLRGDDHVQNEYAPVVGVTALRQAVADLYNTLFRTGKASQYTFENVAISSGGRAGLTRIIAAQGDVHIGHMIPDYTAYEELLTTFKGFTPIPLLLDEGTGYALTSLELQRMIQKLGLRAVLLSNPCNPTGQVMRGKELESAVSVARDEQCSLIVDEFYSHYIYGTDAYEQPNIVSAARFVEDVNRDPMIILDGLTKNWRRPGWRISWTLASKDVIERIASAGSFLDGGAPHPLQCAAVSLLNPALVCENTVRLQEHFSKKRTFMLERLASMNIEVAHPPQGSFYVWAKLDALPEKLRNGMDLFHACLEEKVIIVPGEFFDVNPGKRRKNIAYRNYARISFGPSVATLRTGLDSLERVLRR